ncbi:MAG: transcription-repair coupling factor [Legionellales bacterium]|nr:transcription-repair coupling factor [Legionellales bacterium]|tara:strand:- start:2124 stop:5459 length:3336 start_codon:yes stop_codon:yes gene_type:complete
MLTSANSLIETIIDQIDHSRSNILVLFEHNHAAESFIQDLSYFTKSKSISQIFFPDYEMLSYEFSEINPNITASRNRALFQMHYHKRWLLATTPSSLFQPIPDQGSILRHCLELSVGQDINIDQLSQQLSLCYKRVTEVKEVGEYAIKGNLFDIFPNGSQLPCRVELDDDVVLSMRFFDPIQQRSLRPCGYVSIIPCQEIILTAESKKTFIRQWSEHCFPNKHPHRVMVTKNNTSKLQSYIPLFYEKNTYLTDIISANQCLFVANVSPKHCYDRLYCEYETQYQAQSVNPLLKPDEILMPYADFKRTIDGFEQQLACWHHTSQKPIEVNPPNINNPTDISKWLATIRQQDQYAVILSHTLYNQTKSLLDTQPLPCHDNYQSWLDMQPPLSYTKHDFLEPYWLASKKLSILTPKCLHYHTPPAKQKQAREHNSYSGSHLIDHLNDLQTGQLLTHQSFGIGRFKGLKPITTGNDVTSEYLVLEYQNNDTVYVPVYNLDAVRLYTSTAGSDSELSNLNSKKWKKNLEKAKKITEDYAAEILKSQAERSLYKTNSCVLMTEAYTQFCNEFPFDETPDQLRASAEIAKDLCEEKPMERLLCADVSFGKTEVAMRACFQVVTNHYQVVVLVPTTILAKQHYQNFTKRFDSHQIKLACIDGSTSKKEKNTIIDAYNNQSIHILVGTHSILSIANINATIGLIIVDEEHRFGVKQKEKIKQFKKGCHYLMMSATPIPRTLNFAMSYLHDLSLMTTAPDSRIPIITTACRYNEKTIDDAIQREIKRGGQIYYVYNDVDRIQYRHRDISSRHPTLRIGIAHAQLNKRELEHTMHNFYNHHLDMIVCSTVIESGIDISNANTIIIERSDKFGLAQLHQLRGRVGRSSQQGYAYLLNPETGDITAEAEKRLASIVQCKDLGTSFQLALRDLEIRGAGNVLGTEQSGSMNQIGFHLYTDMLQKACKTLDPTTHDESPIEHCHCQVSTNAYIEDSYIEDVSQRLSFYKRLSSANSFDTIDLIHEELNDRYGTTSNNVQQLIFLTKLKCLASQTGITKITGTDEKITLHLSLNHAFDQKKLLTQLMSKKTHASPGPNDTIRFDFKDNQIEVDQRLLYIIGFIKSIS